jgi:hypothetical protein
LPPHPAQTGAARLRALEGVVIRSPHAAMELKALFPPQSSYADEIPGSFSHRSPDSCLILFTIPSLAIGAISHGRPMVCHTRAAMAGWPAGFMPRIPSAPPWRAAAGFVCCRRLVIQYRAGRDCCESVAATGVGVWSRHHPESTSG